MTELVQQLLVDDADEELGWQERALCAQTDPESFFPEKGGSTREAKKVCLACEVRSECLEYALANDERLYTLSVGVSLLNQQIATNPSLQMAAATVMVIPILIVFVVFQRYVVQGFALSGLK